MIDPVIAMAKLEQLAWLAATAVSDIDKAALYGATMALINAMNEENQAVELGMVSVMRRTLASP